MATIHDEIDNWLAADVHEQLSEEERHELHTHLVECPTCRKLHQENKIMNQILQEKFTQEKPDAAFEQRMVAGFQDRIPEPSGGVAKLIVDLMRLRPVQITALAAVLLALVQVGRIITGEGTVARRNREYAADSEFAAQSAQLPLPSSNEAAALSKSAIRQDRATDRLATGQFLARPQRAAAPAAPQTEAKDKKTKAR